MQFDELLISSQSTKQVANLHKMLPFNDMVMRLHH